MGHPLQKEEVHYHETRIALLEQTAGNIEKTLTKLETKMDAGFKGVNDRLWRNFYFTVAGFAGVLGILAHAVHWF